MATDDFHLPNPHPHINSVKAAKMTRFCLPGIADHRNHRFTFLIRRGEISPPHSSASFVEMILVIRTNGLRVLRKR